MRETDRQTKREQDRQKREGGGKRQRKKETGKERQREIGRQEDRERERDGERKIKRDRQADRQTEKERDRKRENVELVLCVILRVSRQAISKRLFVCTCIVKIKRISVKPPRKHASVECQTIKLNQLLVVPTKVKTGHSPAR